MTFDPDERAKSWLVKLFYSIAPFFLAFVLSFLLLVFPPEVLDSYGKPYWSTLWIAAYVVHPIWLFRISESRLSHYLVGAFFSLFSWVISLDATYFHVGVDGLAERRGSAVHFFFILVLAAALNLVIFALLLAGSAIRRWMGPEDE